MRTLIIQTSPFHTGSTFLINALYGLIPELNNKRIIAIWDNEWEKEFEDIMVIKCHITNINELMTKYNDKYNLYFICSERIEKQKLINEKYKSYKNVIVFPFSELNETNTNDIPTIITNIYNKMNKMLNIELNISSGINRIIEMNKRYEKIKLLPFSYTDEFYELHGSHRNRLN